MIDTIIETLECTDNEIKNLDKIPNTILDLDCSSNKLDDQDFIALKNLTILDCSYNDIKKLVNLPDTLVNLDCYHNELVELRIHSNLIEVDCSNNKIMLLDFSLNKTSESLTKLDCSNNLIEKIIDPPPSLEYLDCSNNMLNSVNELNKLDIDTFIYNDNPIEDNSCKSDDSDGLYADLGAFNFGRDFNNYSRTNYIREDKTKVDLNHKL